MSETPPRYRTLDRPGPGLATIEEPDGRVTLWSLDLRAGRFRPCARCGTLATRMYHRMGAQHDKAKRPRLCRPCVEDVAEGLEIRAHMCTVFEFRENTVANSNV
jgi:hypothetical protein